MNSERVNLSKQVGLIADSFFMILAFFISYYFRSLFTQPPFHKLAPVGYYFWLLAVSLPFSWICLLLMGAYSTKPSAKRNFFGLFFRYSFGMLLVLSLISFIFGTPEINRTLAIPFVLLSAFFFALWRIWLMNWQKARGISRRTLLIGEGSKLAAIVDQLRSEPLKDFEVVGALTDEEVNPEQANGLRILGHLDDLYRVLHEEVVDEVIFGVPLSEMKKYRDLLTLCETLGVNVLILMDDEWSHFSRVDVGKILSRPFVYLAFTPVNEVGSWAKEIFDRVFAFTVLLITFPLLILIAVLVKLSSSGPVLFIQDRTGLKGRKFRMYKFRTMSVDAAEKKSSLQKQNEMQGPVFKMRNDPRVTRIGYLLRRYSLDELPQFFNVLAGDMSLVGPRPLPCEEAALIHGLQRRRFSVKPGMTCIWQISGRNQISYEEWMKLDLQYVDRWSLGLDLKILLKTPGAIISSKGAF
jgi:exopolysaccharide biosynthesis polyprenyl glycosylphosphotransferase